MRRVVWLALGLAACLSAGPVAAQHADVIVPAENLVVDGIPSLPVALKDEVRRHDLQRPDLLLAGRRRDFQLCELPDQHRELPA